MVFSSAPGRPEWRFPNITITDRARLYFWKPGSPILLSNKKMSVPLEKLSVAHRKWPVRRETTLDDREACWGHALLPLRR